MGLRIIAILGLLAGILGMYVCITRSSKIDGGLLWCTGAGIALFFGILIRNKSVHGKF